MSIPSRVTAQCGKCQKEFESTVWQSINVSLVPEMNAREKIRDLEFYKIRCPHCGNESPICYPSLYHDMEDGRKTIIQIIPAITPNREEQIENVRENFQIFLGDYLKRVVSDPVELAQKLLLQDNGLDDRVFEVYKYMLYAQEINDVPGFTEEQYVALQLM